MPGFKYVPADSPVTLDLTPYQTANYAEKDVFISASGTVTVNLPAISAIDNKTSEVIAVQNGGGGATLTIVPNAADRLSTGSANASVNSIGGTVHLKIAQVNPGTWEVILP